MSSSDVSAGVAAAAQEFFDDLNIAFATGDLTKFEALTSPGCTCRKAATAVANIYAKHQRTVGVANTVKSIRIASITPNAGTAEIYYSISSGRILDSRGIQVGPPTKEEPNGHSYMFIAFSTGAWLILKNTLLDPGA